MLNSSHAEFVYFWIDVQGIYLEILYRVINIVARVTRVHRAESCDHVTYVYRGSALY